MSAIRKFAFETVFDAAGAIVRDGDGFRTQFTADEMAEARAQALEEGRLAGERGVAIALATLANEMRTLLSRIDGECKILRDEAAALALAAAKKAADVALEAHGAERVIAALNEAMDGLRAGPRLVVRLAPVLVGGLKSRLEETARAQGFDGALIVRADPAVAVGDMTLEWAEGAIAHDRAAAFARMEETIARALAAADQDSEQA